MKAINIPIFFLIVMIFLGGCREKGCTDDLALNYSQDAKKDDGSCEYSSIEFDRSSMLKNYAENIISVAYSELKNELESVESAFLIFEADTSANSFNALNAQFKLLYKAWQNASTFEFGPAENKVLRSAMNTFPADTSQIESNVISGSYNLESASNIAAIGLPAVDYLLNAQGALNKFYSGARMQYLKDVIAEMKTKVNAVNTEWGSYESNFVSDLDNTAGSPISLLVNQLNYDLELLKNARIGIPLGKKTLNIPQPEQVEAFYAGWSLELAKAHLNSLESHFKGSDGQGLDDYLDFLDARNGDALLSKVILDQFQTIQSILDPIPDPLTDRIVDQTSNLDKAYNEIQKLVVLTKTDMPSSLGVLITYQDNDGD
jgi:hypothetical protein